MMNPDPQEHRSGRQGHTDFAHGHDGLKAAHFVHETGRNLRGSGAIPSDCYVAEQVFRYNHRSTKDKPLTDGDRFALAVSHISGKRLT